MKIAIKLATKRAYGVYEDEKLVYQTGDIDSICRFCKKRYSVDAVLLFTIVVNTPCGMQRRFAWNGNPVISFEA